MLFQVKQANIDTKITTVDENGEIVEIERQLDEYGIPRDGEHRLVFNGYSDIFEMDGQYGVQDKIRLEFMVSETGRDDGKMFTALMTASVSARSTMGGILAALVGGDLKEGEEIELDGLLGASMYGVTRATISAGSGREYVKLTAVRPDTGDGEDDAEEVPAKSSKPRAERAFAKNS